MVDENATANARAELLAKKAAREAARRIEQEAAEVELLELQDKYETEVGVEGRDFAIVDASDLGEGFIVLKLGADVQFNTFKASKMDVVDVDTFVAPCVLHPSKDDYRKITKRRPFIGDRCANALSTLYGVKLGGDAKK